jgi:histidyl-tRNA synthetase
MDLSPLQGFRDFLPLETARRDYIFRRWREAAQRYGFSAYDGPPLETTDLYRRKSGDELMGQLYSFTTKGESGKEVTLRPEMTPSLARMVASKGQSLPKPLKWFSIPQLFRYERPQKGRLREHYQWNCDILGEASVHADAELVALLIDALTSFGLSAQDFRIRISDRQLLAAIIESFGIQGEDRLKIVFQAIDKITREPPEKIQEKLITDGIDKLQAEKILSLFKTTSLNAITSEFDSSPKVCERILLLQQYFGIVEAMGLQEYIQFDLTIVRGLAYYTGIVFEAFDHKGEFRAICGGGRYDELLKKVGGIELPALGFGMGDVVLGEILSSRNLWPDKLLPALDIYLILVDEKLRLPMLSLAHQLRSKGLSVDYHLTESNVGKQFKSASQKDAHFAVIVGPDEWKRGVVKIKILASREEKEITLNDLLNLPLTTHEQSKTH